MLKLIDWKHGFSGEDTTIGPSGHEATPMVSENTLEISSVSGYPSSFVSGSQGSSSMVDQSFKFEGGLTTPSGAQSPVHRCFPKGLVFLLEASNGK